MKEAGVEPRLLIADAVVQAVVIATLWMFLTASPHVYLALKAEFPICILEHCVPVVLQEHTQTLLWAPQPAFNAQQELTAGQLASILNQIAPRVQQVHSTVSLDQVHA